MKTNTFNHLLELCLLLILAAGSIEASAQIKHAVKKPKFAIILLDETDSFGSNTQHGTAQSLYWPDALAMTKLIVQNLEPGDEFVVLAIDEVGFQEEDILIPFHQFDRAFLKSRIEKKRILNNIMNLSRHKEKYSRTDILGSMYQAAHFAAKESEFEISVFCFSDMIQEPNWPSLADAKGLSFPSNATGYFFFVDASGQERWQKLVEVWKPIFENAGLGVYDDGALNFFQHGESALAVKRILSNW